MRGCPAIKPTIHPLSAAILTRKPCVTVLSTKTSAPNAGFRVPNRNVGVPGPKFPLLNPNTLARSFNILIPSPDAPVQSRAVPVSSRNIRVPNRKIPVPNCNFPLQSFKLPKKSPKIAVREKTARPLSASTHAFGVNNCRCIRVNIAAGGGFEVARWVRKLHTA